MGIDILTQAQWMAPDELNTSSKEPFIDEQQRHKFLSVFPWSDKNRNAYVIQPPTETIADLIFAAISQKLQATRVDLFSKLLASNAFTDRCLASHFYNRNFPDFLCHDVVLDCYFMQPTSSMPSGMRRTWTNDTAKSDAHSFHMHNCCQFRFDPNQPLSEWKLGYFYTPKARTFPTFDALLVVSKTHVVIFQASIARRHGLSLKGLQWLADQGFLAVEYVYLSPSSTTKVSIPFPLAVPESLQYPDLKKEPKTIIPQKPPCHSGAPSAPGGTVLPVKVIRIYHMILDFTYVFFQFSLSFL